MVMFWKKHPRFLGIIAAGPIVWHNNISFSTVQYSRVEWFSTFCDFQNWTHCCQSVQFQNQKINKLGRARKVFIFKKFTGTFKINIFSLFSNIFRVIVGYQHRRRIKQMKSQRSLLLLGGPTLFNSLPC